MAVKYWFSKIWSTFRLLRSRSEKQNYYFDKHKSQMNSCESKLQSCQDYILNITFKNKQYLTFKMIQQNFNWISPILIMGISCLKTKRKFIAHPFACFLQKLWLLADFGKQYQIMMRHKILWQLLEKTMTKDDFSYD